ncbi:hypothetical protein NDU88_003424 [Pleurodeles waltl]|uniref:Uncharacterized protein n=1 Tax=Pleurodeles waltl TaxID=8319 RepID=A0AAV7SFA8_PLEWA|nr:hypothetical protein NDU88_003424 [Pleurodeles waltl]
MHYRNQDILLNCACKEGPYQIENGKENMFPDYTATVQEKVVSYAEVKKVLRDEYIQFSLLFSSKLKLLVVGKRHAFDNLSRSVGLAGGAEDKLLGWKVAQAE